LAATGSAAVGSASRIRVRVGVSGCDRAANGAAAGESESIHSAATLAGVTGMPLHSLLFFSIAGSTVWVSVFTLIGYFVASLFPELVTWVHAIIVMGIIVIVASALKHLAPPRKSLKKQPEGR
jgi:hypothetical protein